MSSGDNPFQTPDVIRELYGTADRQRSRVGTLLHAKVRGRDPIDVTIEYLLAKAAARTTVADIGCGLGGGTSKIERGLSPARLVAVDRSLAMLAATRSREPRAALVCADFHRLPFAAASIDVIVAAFCLYHASTPELVCAELARCLTAAGHAAVITKGRHSYVEIDRLLDLARVTEHGVSRPSLYESFCAENAVEIVATAMRIDASMCEEHVFRFATPGELCTYVRTSPKYGRIMTDITSDDLLGSLARVWPRDGLVVTSDVRVVLGRPR